MLQGFVFSIGLLGLILLILEIIFLTVMPVFYYKNGPLLTKRDIKGIYSNDLFEKIKNLRIDDMLISKSSNDSIFIHFKTSLMDFYSRGYIHTQRIILTENENGEGIKCESRKLISSVTMPIAFIVVASYSFITPEHGDLYVKIIATVVVLILGLGMNLLLRGKDDVIGYLENKLKEY